ncbi:MAG: WD40 repeat domain-containing protein [Myxococcota bacterium]|nr:WD40 repeat domain-containing protein [Myxococcota bacterium]
MGASIALMWVVASIGLACSAWAQNASGAESATELVEELVVRLESDRLESAWLRAHFEACDPTLQPEGLAQVNVERVRQELAPGPGLYRGLIAGRTAVLGVVEGPDYVRVVMQGSPWVTVVVSGGPHPRIRTIERSTCGLCEEPERFVRDLLVDVRSRGDGSHRLLPGVELELGDLLEGDAERAAEWHAAWQARHVTAGYTRWLLEQAHVTGSNGSRVEVAWADSVEQWPLVYLGGRWRVDYRGLEAGSLLGLPWSEVERWQDSKHLEESRVRWWLPLWRKQAGRTLVAKDVLFAAPRPAQGDLLVYAHDVGRRFAHLALLDPESGEVLGAFELPTLPERIYMPLGSWRGLFRFALSPSGSLFAVAAHDRLWVVESDTGVVVYSQQKLAGAGAMAFSRDGTTLAVAERYSGAIRLLDVSAGFKSVDLVRLWPANVQSLLASDEGWLILFKYGRVRRVSHRELSAVLGPDERVCCGRVGEVTQWARTGGLVVACSEPCDGGTLWLWEPLEGTQPAALGKTDSPPGPGAMALDPSGEWLVITGAEASKGAALLSMREPDRYYEFGETPLLQAHWDPNGDTLWTVDALGRSWKWSLASLSRAP